MHPFKKIPVDKPSKLHAFMMGIYRVDQSRAEQVILLKGAGRGFIGDRKLQYFWTKQTKPCDSN